MARANEGRRGRLGVAAAALACLGLGACVEGTAASPPETALAEAPIAKREGVSLADATVAVVTLDGAPAVAADDFRKALARQLSARDVVATAPKNARYLLRVYLSASTADGGATLEYVVDVYDQRRARAARLEDGLGVSGSGDAWSLMSEAVMENVAGKCADEVAAFLSNTPEAAPAAAQAMSYAQ
jgi:hypothetical protein